MTQTKTDDTTDLLKYLDGENFSFPQHQIWTAGTEPVNLAAMIKRAVQQPIDYPPLNQSIFPGDTVAIAMQDNVPQPAEVLEVLLGVLIKQDIELADVTVVIPASLVELLNLTPFESTMASETSVASPPMATLHLENHSVDCHVHQPDDENALRYLIANSSGDPVHLNRMLVDADVVIPIGCVRAAGKEIPDTIYPTYGSAEAVERFGSGVGSPGERRDEVQLANDTLGAFFSVQLVVGPGDTIQEVHAGVRNLATALAEDATQKFWTLPVAQRGDSIVATIESLPQNQNWKDFAAALINASRLTEDDAPIVIWSEIATRPGRKIRKALQSRFEETISHKLSSKLQHVAAIVAERPVFLRSRLPRTTVEDCGLAVIETTGEILRLTGTCHQRLVIRDAHRIRLQTM